MLMEWTLVGSVCLLATALTIEALRRSLLDSIKHSLYRVRDKVYDDVLDSKLEMDRNVTQFVNTIHSIIYILENWPVPAVVRALRKVDTPPKKPAWMEDEKLKEYGQSVMISATLGMLLVSIQFKLSLIAAVGSLITEKSLHAVTDLALKMVDTHSSTDISDSARASVAHG